MSDTIDMDNMTDEEFEAAMNTAIANDTGLGDEDVQIDDESNDDDGDVNTNDDTDTDDNEGTDDSDDVSLDDDDAAQDGDELNDDNTDELDKDDLEKSEDDEGTKDSNDDDTDGDDDTDDDSDDSDDETDTGKTDDDDTDDQTDDTKDVDTKPDEQLQPRKIRADGVEYEFTQEETDKLAEKGINYTKKMQAIAPWRKTISALETEKITHEDMNLMIDAMKGDKEAIASILKRTGVEAIDLVDNDSDVEFKPKDYGKSTAELDIEEITSSISQDKEYAITHNVVSKQWDDASRDAMFEDPQMIALLHEDVKNGTYDKVAPIAMKLKIFGDSNKSDIDYYKEAGNVYFNKLKSENQANEASAKAESEAKLKAESEAKENADKIAKTKADEKKRNETKESAKGRKNAATTKSKAGNKGVIDYLDMDNMSDDDFSAMMDKEIRKK